MDKKYVCLITGASRGLGRVLSQYFWHQGWNLILVARNKQGLIEIIRSLGERKDQSADAIVADLTDPGGAVRVIEEARSLVQTLDVLINNAAIQGAVGSLWENDWDKWLETLQVDLLAPVALCRMVASWMLDNGGGSIINLSGGGAAGPRANFSAYATAKAGLVRFSETLAEELKPYNVRVNCIAPGAMRTAMLEEIVAKGEKAAGKKEYEMAVRVLREGGESMWRVAELCHFLSSDVGAGITGKLISAVWDDWERWPEHLNELRAGDVYTLRRITGRDRGFSWGDK